MVSKIKSKTYGVIAGGASSQDRTVEVWTLTGRGGLVLEAMTYGGIVTRLLAPGRGGRVDDVVLGFNDLDSYLAGHPYFGAITGRVAGRIANATFTLDGNDLPTRPQRSARIICMVEFAASTSACGMQRR